MKINSYEKEKFEVGKEYWTYYMETSNKGNTLRYYTGVFKTKLESLRKTDYNGIPTEETLFWRLSWNIDALAKKGSTFRHNVSVYMGGYGSASCDYFDSYEEAAKSHDAKIKDFARHLNTGERKSMFSKLIYKDNLPKVSDIEKNSVDWFKKLSATEKKYVKWIKDFYEEI